MYHTSAWPSTPGISPPPAPGRLFRARATDQADHERLQRRFDGAAPPREPVELAVDDQHPGPNCEGTDSAHDGSNGGESLNRVSRITRRPATVGKERVWVCKHYE